MNRGPPHCKRLRASGYRLRISTLVKMSVTPMPVLRIALSRPSVQVG